MNSRIDRGQQTRTRIIGTATALFTSVGYEAVAIGAVLTGCGLSRGALYHHFASKQALFIAVLDAVEQRIASELAAAAQGATNPLDALRAGCAAWLRLAATDATVRQVVLIDAPSVLGWQAWRAMDGDYGLGLLRAALAMAAEAGRIGAAQVDVFAHVLLAVLIEVALLIARAPDDRAMAQAATDAVEQVLSSLLNVPPHDGWAQAAG